MNIDIAALLAEAAQGESSPDLTERLAKALEREHKRSQLLGGVVDDMYKMRVSSLHPDARTSEEVEGPVDDERWNKDIGYLFTIITEQDEAYRKLSFGGVAWDELTVDEKEKVQSATFVHNFVKRLALWSGDAAKLADELRAEGYDRADKDWSEVGFEDPWGESDHNPYKGKK